MHLTNLLLPQEVWFSKLFTLFLCNLNNFCLELYVPNTVQAVPRLSSLEFLRDYVSKNIPVVLTDIISNWNAVKNWDLEYLTKKIGDTEVTVSQTPNGRADAVISFPSSKPPYPITGNYLLISMK